MAIKWDTIDGARDTAKHVRDTEGKTCGLYEAVHASVRTRFFAAKGRPSKRDAGVDLRCLALFTPEDPEEIKFVELETLRRHAEPPIILHYYPK